MKHITLVWPNIGRLMKDSGEHPYFDSASMEPLPLAAIAAMIPEEFELALYDDRFDEIPFDTPTSLVCISIEIFTARRGYEIADEYRKRNIKVLIGGIHASLLPDEAKNHADSVFIGDAETIWPQLMEDLIDGKLRDFYTGPVSNQLTGKFPRREIFRNHPYLPLMLLQFGRGCPYSCNFCAIAACFRQTHITRPVHDVINEIKLDGRKLLFFVDDNIVADPNAAKELFRALIPLDIKWMGQASIDMAMDEELLELMNKSGCLGHVIGFESVSSEGLYQLNKHVNLIKYDQYESQLKKLTKHGIQIWAALVIGHDADTPSTIRETLDFTKHHKFAFAAFNLLMPYPRTPLYDELKEQKRLLFNDEWWLHPDYRFNHSAFIPKNFTPDELTIACQQIKNEYNSYFSIFQRVIKAARIRKNISSALFLLRYSYLFRTESFKKSYLKLGKKLK
jgi:radical SAM superfamily enzyme YgiQ (UPF0313 family)